MKLLTSACRKLDLQTMSHPQILPLARNLAYFDPCSSLMENSLLRSLLRISGFLNPGSYLTQLPGEVSTGERILGSLQEPGQKRQGVRGH